MERIFDGLNTYESTQIGDGESKYPLNCWNNQGKLKRQEYDIDFDIEPTKVYEREYDSMSFDTDTSETVDRFSLEFGEEAYQHGIVKMPSGIIKPTASIYVDTSKEEENGYLKAVDKLKKITFEGNGKSLLGNKLDYSLKDNGSLCEVYQYVEIAVSYSGVYGESGLTWFRLPNYTLHGFIFIDNLYSSVMQTVRYTDERTTLMQDYQREDYQYLNVYIKYGNLENLSLLMKIDLKSDDFRNAYNSPIEIDYDRNPYDEDNSVKSFNFYTWYRRDSTFVTGEMDDSSGMTDDYCDSNNFISKNDFTLCIYTGLFQFEDPDRMNLSWFVANRYLPNRPTVEVETQTYLSTDDYDLLVEKYDNILSEIESNQSNVNNATNNVPWLGAHIFSTGWDTGVFHDTVFVTENNYNKDDISDTNNRDYGGCSDKRNALGTQSSLGQVCWETIYKPKNNPKFYDMLGENVTGSKIYTNGRYERSGTIIFQYWLEIDNEFNLIKTQSVKSVNGSTFNNFRIPNFLKKYTDEDQNWKIDVWFSPDKDITVDDDYKFYKVFSQSCSDLWELYITNGFGNPPLTGNYLNTGGPTAYANDIAQTLHTYEVKTNWLPYRAGYFGSLIYEETGVKTAVDLLITLNFGLLYKKRDELFVNVDYPDQGTIQESVQDDLEALMINVEGLYNKDWKVLQDGIKITNTEKLGVRTQTRHLEKYDGRLWQSCKDETDEFQDLYYSQQTFPEMFLETNYKGYDSKITGLKEFIEQLYVFENDQINVVKKQLARELNGIVEPTYQYHKTFDKGAIEFTITEYEKKIFFTNPEGQYFIEASGNYRKISDKIDRLFQENYITDDTVDYSEMRGNFYVTVFKDTIPGDVFFDIEFGRQDTKFQASWFEVKYLAYDVDSNTYWLGNDIFTSSWVYMTKDFDGRGKYDNFAGVNQLKRLSVDYDKGNFGLMQIKNRHFPLNYFPYPVQNGYRRPIRHTLSGQRNHYFGFVLIGSETVEIVDMKLLENGK